MESIWNHQLAIIHTVEIFVYMTHPTPWFLQFLLKILHTYLYRQRGKKVNKPFIHAHEKSVLTIY